MLGKNQEYIYYQITHNGGKPKEFDELYFDYIDEFQTDKDLINSIDKLIKLNKVQKIYFNPHTDTYNKIQLCDDERLSYLPQSAKIDIIKMMA
jgi:hypothetical protein